MTDAPPDATAKEQQEAFDRVGISDCTSFAEGAHPKAIQTRMGHSSINVTLDRYGHLFPELDEAIAIGFGERLGEARRARKERTVVVHA